jgi:DNA-binding MurR/RpiR family transcriptional regulator
VAALQTVAQLAVEAGVSSPSVLRLVSRLGYSTFGEFQGVMRSVVQDRLSSQQRNFVGRMLSEDGAEDLTDTAAQIYRGIRKSLASVSLEQRQRASQLLTAPTKTIHVMGGAIAGLAAAYLARELQLVRAHVSEVPGERWGQSRRLMDIGSRDVVVAYDFRRYHVETVEFSLRAAERGAKVILITDPWTSPIVQCADVLISVHREASSVLSPVAAAMAVTELLLTDAMRALGDESLARLIEHDKFVKDVVALHDQDSDVAQILPRLLGHLPSASSNDETP